MLSRRYNLRFAFVPVVCGLLMCPSLRGADDDALKQWEMQKSLSEKFFSDMQMLGDRRIDDLFHIRLEGRILAFSSPAAATPGEKQMRVRVEGLPGNGYVAIHRDPITRELDRFELSVTDFPRPNRASTLQIRCEPDKGRLDITQTSEIDGGHQHAMLLQERGSEGYTAPFIQLSVSNSSPDGHSAQQFEYSAADFLSLVRDNPEAANLYLRPLLRRIEHEQLFSPDPTTAWEVFSDIRTADPLIVRKINDLLPRFNDPQYRVRKAALAELKRLPQPAGADAVRHLNRSGLTPEQNVMLDLYLTPFTPMSEAQVNQLRADPTFLLDCLYSEDLQIRRAALDRIRTLFHPELDFDLEAPADVRALAVANLRKQLTPNR
jgi:hypothetical protein